VRAFTIVEVMMASIILVVGIAGMISAVTVSSEMLSTARRQTIASQVIANELEKLRFESWATIYALPTTTTWISGTAYSVGNTVTYNGGSFQCITAHTASASITPMSGTYWSAYMTYTSSNTNYRGDLVYYPTTGQWYRYIYSSSSTGVTPTNTTYWSVYSGAIASTGIGDNVSFTITRTVVDVTTDLREVAFVISWTKSGTTTAATTATGSWLNQLSFSRSSPISRTYTRSATGYFGRYGLNGSIQRS
jgi:Tfp pilus assembly protein PilV